MKKRALVTKIAKNGTFFNLKNGKIQCAHFKCPIFIFFAHKPLPISIACVFHPFAAA
jgi:hypothetical protein